jgi:hypothetical protein
MTLSTDASRQFAEHSLFSGYRDFLSIREMGVCMVYWPLLLCLVSTCYFVGLIWTIQLVQYPLFAYVDKENFVLFHAEHSRRIVFALGVPFLLGFLSATTMLWIHPIVLPIWALVLNLLLACAVWIMTALIHVPLHSELGRQYSQTIIQRLVATNWLRTITWTLQALLLVILFVWALHMF